MLLIGSTLAELKAGKIVEIIDINIAVKRTYETSVLLISEGKDDK